MRRNLSIDSKKAGLTRYTRTFRGEENWLYSYAPLVVACTRYTGTEPSVVIFEHDSLFEDSKDAEKR